MPGSSLGTNFVSDPLDRLALIALVPDDANVVEGLGVVSVDLFADDSDSGFEGEAGDATPHPAGRAGSVDQRGGGLFGDVPLDDAELHIRPYAILAKNDNDCRARSVPPPLSDGRTEQWPMTDADPPTGPAEGGDTPTGDRDADRQVQPEPDTSDGVDDASTVESPVDRETLRTDVRTIEARIRWKWLLGAVFAAAVAGVAIGALSVFALEWGPLPGVGAFLLVALLGGIHVVLLYRSWEYQVREDALYLERGVLTHVTSVVPFVRVQHIDTSRGPIERALSLSSLVVYTAGSRGADVTIPGLRPAEAEELQNRLKVLAKDTADEDAV
jgi:membrane protein YdbS with pleckstrin-like domain